MIRFAKAHAYGNDFLYVEQAAVAGVDLPALARAHLRPPHRRRRRRPDRVRAHRGEAPRCGLFNADGGRAEVSGNGVRGLAALLLQAANQSTSTR